MKVESSENQDETSYVPVIAVFSTAGLMALATTMGITGFMGFSLSFISIFKVNGH